MVRFLDVKMKNEKKLLKLFFILIVIIRKSRRKKNNNEDLNSRVQYYKGNFEQYLLLFSDKMKTRNTFAKQANTKMFSKKK